MWLKPWQTFRTEDKWELSVLKQPLVYFLLASYCCSVYACVDMCVCVCQHIIVVNQPTGRPLNSEVWIIAVRGADLHAADVIFSLCVQFLRCYRGREKTSPLENVRETEQASQCFHTTWGRAQTGAHCWRQRESTLDNLLKETYYAFFSVSPFPSACCMRSCASKRSWKLEKVKRLNPTGSSSLPQKALLWKLLVSVLALNYVT